MVLIKQLKGYKEYKTTISNMEKKVLELKKNEEIKEEIWILEHQEVITAGSSSNQTFTKINNIPFVKINRGGQLTYHGPGQIVIYFMLNIKKRKIGIIEFIDIIENELIEVFKKKGILLNKKKEKNRGLWIKTKSGEKKIIFVGLRYTSGILYHGISINIKPNLFNFRLIDPCGLKKNQISSLHEQNININEKKLLEEIKNQIFLKFSHTAI